MTVAALVILGPLVAAALILVLRRGAAGIALSGSVVAAIAALATLARAVSGVRDAATLPGLPGLPLRLTVDPLAAVLVTVVAVVALLVLVYAVGYMADEEGQGRFYAGMSCFAGAMATLVLAGDWLLFLASWELIGCASYLLIGFWFAREGIPSAATLAFLTTRAADLGLYLGVFTLIGATGTSAIAPTLAVGGMTATIAGLLLTLAALGKAGQVPFHGWLQDAMAGPTPVSALLHSATLVAAGAILLIRAAPMLTGPVLLAIGLAGGLTALLTGLTALAQGDLKRLLAASTSSQLGFMLLALGAGSPGAAVAHLVAHAAMKSALFLGAGVFQHARDSTAFADLGGVGRRHPRIYAGFAFADLGGVGRRHPRIYAGFALAGLALAGVPPLAGFWTKDTILAATFVSPYAAILAPLALLGTMLTGGYVARALRLLWRGEEKEAGEQVAGLDWMGSGLAALAALAAALGLAVRPLGALLAVAIPEELGATLAGLVAALGGLAVGWAVPTERLFGPARGWAAVGFRISGGFVGLVVRPTLALARAVETLDRRIAAGVQRIGHTALAVAGVVRATDRRDHAAVEGLGRGALALAARSRQTDERGIDGLIAGLVRGTRDLAGQARRLQSGLVHRELTLATGGAAVLLVLLLLGYLLARV